jgi:SAM-dependent methyltransferase
VKPTLLPFLACQGCGEDFEIARADSPEDVREGELSCTGCGARIPIRQGVPDFTGRSEDEVQEESRRTQENFGYSWNNFYKTQTHFDEQFHAWIAPFRVDEFRDRIVLDAGCGMGRHADVVARAGARTVIAADFSSAVYPAERRLAGYSNAHVIRADIYRLPLKRRFEVAYSVGVLHHLPDPKKGFESVLSKLIPGGRMIAWVYGAENNGWITHLVSPLRERILSRMPMPALKAASYGLTLLGLYPALKLVYAPVSRNPRLRPVKERLFYTDYLSSIAPYSFEHIYGIVFDHLLAPIAFYLSKEEVEQWARDAHLEEPLVRWHNKNSWTLIGRTPTETDSTQQKPTHHNPRKAGHRNARSREAADPR